MKSKIKFAVSTLSPFHADSPYRQLLPQLSDSHPSLAERQERTTSAQIQRRLRGITAKAAGPDEANAQRFVQLDLGEDPIGWAVPGPSEVDRR
jgi:hypothetical protein